MPSSPRWPFTSSGRATLKKVLLIGAGVACLAAAQSAIPVHAQPQTQAPAADTQECPARQLRPPRYPMAQAKAGRGGHGVVSIAFDACGRVTDVRMAKKTGNRALDEASLATARTWTLGKPQPDWKLVDGRYEAPVDFFPPSEVGAMSSPEQLGWPATHARPRYELESASEALPSFAEAHSLISGAFLQGRIGAPLYLPGLPMYERGLFVATGNAAAPEFWYRNGNLAARYRPVVENDEPVVKVALVCATAQDGCAQYQADVLKGLPFAKAKN
ncbi:energy transducer TonB [Lysobacter sp. LF1]|uniref:Energy transducer TonB n=1 Tax=Lysobacter stagni TaxID=3045172 RepID=A0ABT6XGN8_9GAMM|nr:energy transducer TonB [Lysobacter sp. LF1]MDI9239118.1 energy transducer TonB [Lysobacter sp. LF1]